MHAMFAGAGAGLQPGGAAQAAREAPGQARGRLPARALDAGHRHEAARAASEGDARVGGALRGVSRRAEHLPGRHRARRGG